MVMAKKLLNSERFVSKDGVASWILTFYMESTGEIKTVTVEEDANTLVSNETLPEYVQKLDTNTQAKWLLIYREALDEGTDVALLTANLWLARQQAKKVNPNPDKVVERVQFELDTTQPEIVTRTENGQEYVSFKLADVMKDKLGVQLNSDILKSWADKINAGAAFQGDIDHQEYDKLIAMGLSEEEIKERLVGKNGLATAVQAIYEKGKLWVRALIDKRYKRQIQKAKGVSMEALITRDDNDNVVDGELLGWTFAVNHDPVVAGSGIAM